MRSFVGITVGVVVEACRRGRVDGGEVKLADVSK
jgi:hypothetical protein